MCNTDDIIENPDNISVEFVSKRTDIQSVVSFKKKTPKLTQSANGNDVCLVLSRLTILP